MSGRPCRATVVGHGQGHCVCPGGQEFVTGRRAGPRRRTVTEVPGVACDRAAGIGGTRRVELDRQWSDAARWGQRERGYWRRIDRRRCRITTTTAAATAATTTARSHRKRCNCDEHGKCSRLHKSHLPLLAAIVGCFVCLTTNGVLRGLSRRATGKSPRVARGARGGKHRSQVIRVHVRWIRNGK
jgi:hypothetical protein